MVDLWTLAAVLSCLLSLLTCWLLLAYFGSLLPSHRNLLTRLDSFLVVTYVVMLEIQVSRGGGIALATIK
jgi:hypothetical protein